MRRRRTSLVLALAFAGFATAPADAALKKWLRPLSGVFSEDAQWTTGEKPQRADSVLFDLSSAYSVRLSGNQMNSRLIVGDDKLVMRLGGGRYSLTSTRLDALVMGRSAGDVSRLTVRDGVLVTPRGVVGSASGTRATLTLNNASWSTRNSVVIGNGGTASMTAISRSTINSTSAILGAKGGSKGNVMLSGRGTVWNISDSLTVAPQGNGLITVRPGAALNVGGTLDLRDNGTIRVQGGSLTANSLLAGGRLDLDSGRLQVGSATVNTGAALVVKGGEHQIGSFNLLGKLSMNSPLARLDVDRLVNVGLITGSGEIDGDVENLSDVRLLADQSLTFGGEFLNRGSVLAERGASVAFDGDVAASSGFGGGGRFIFRKLLGTGPTPTSLSFDGDVEFAETGSLLLNIGARGEHDLLNITGTALLDDITIRLDPNYAGPEIFVPLINAAKLTYGGTINVEAGGRKLDVVRTGQTLGVMLSPIPEPSTASLIVAGAALGLLRRRRLG